MRHILWRGVVRYVAPATIALLAALLIAVTFGLPLLSGWPLIPAAILGAITATIFTVWDVLLSRQV